ncbi:MAG: hypothetical protein V7L23_29350 [Nostoc sp.]|uniref:hypothetical protein n=1 Tax=Nostoc sp. TaxID=1180 RepID=UPI002FEEB875
MSIGKTKSLRGRFSGGHKAFLWAWLDKYSDEDVRIAMQPSSVISSKRKSVVRGIFSKQNVHLGD